MIRIAAAGDVHFDRKSHNRLAQHFIGLQERADVFLLAGDLTQTGHPEEMKVLAEDLKKCPIPIVAVLGNHDYHVDQVETVLGILKEVGVTVLEGTSVTLNIGGYSVGIAGAKGFGGGFVGACGSDFGEPEMKAFMRHSKAHARTLENTIKELETDYKIVLLHYSPTAQTLVGEKKEIYPFLGCYYLAEAIDYGKADIAFHGHAHGGVEKGETPGGIPVRNVAQPVIRHAFNIYTLEKNIEFIVSEKRQMSFNPAMS
ncbi:metallophosphoesterase [Peredibacter sp. HCB2-198]|uniref:metallophosphoesterase family protein n=1 Tax=Peredibacter sp. HCB2-198 TaxID=3383025 RepID=UPI0038B54D34